MHLFLFPHLSSPVSFLTDKKNGKKIKGPYIKPIEKPSNRATPPSFFNFPFLQNSSPYGRGGLLFQAGTVAHLPRWDGFQHGKDTIFVDREYPENRSGTWLVSCVIDGWYGWCIVCK